jgi:hypothetical protein
MLATHSTRAADEPFLLTYSHQMEEPGNLEIETKSVNASKYVLPALAV